CFYIGGGAAQQLTSGIYVISHVRLALDNTIFYFISSEGSFFERNLYSMPIGGGARTRLTSLSGENNVDVSPDETMLADVRSYSHIPPELYLTPSQPMDGKEYAS